MRYIQHLFKSKIQLLDKMNYGYIFRAKENLTEEAYHTEIYLV